MKQVLAVILALVFSVSAFAHEYWLEPDMFFLKAGEETALRLFVGEGLKKEEERLFQASKTPLFRRYSHGVGSGIDISANARDDVSPLMDILFAKAGSVMFAMERNWSYISLEPKEFDQYLREDGMEYIIAEREKRGESGKPGRERYSRFLKTLVQVGDKTDSTYKKRTGLKLEIIPLDDPYFIAVGNSILFKVLFEGKPLREKTIFADAREGESISKSKFTTDRNGEVSVKIGRRGVWLIRLVFMRRCERDCGDADWESFWGAFSFGVR
ncbi:MAG: DUF4198 domain-containing protein [Pyrinomonadaceae bacterium]